jgi:uncharacterized protein with PIN domain
MRFLCDEMRRLGKWLRAAGYETVIAEGGLPDRVVAARYAAEDRILSTGDRHLAATLAGVARALLIAENSLDEIAAALSAALDLDWQRAPFTRCIVDNHPLEPASADLAARVPEKSRAAGGLCGYALIAAASIGREAMSAACSSASRSGKMRPARPTERKAIPGLFAVFWLF